MSDSALQTHLAQAQLQLAEAQLQSSLKSQILTLATAIYGARSASEIAILPMGVMSDFRMYHSVALIAYTSPPGTFTQWKVLLDTSEFGDHEYLGPSEQLRSILEKLTCRMRETMNKVIFTPQRTMIHNDIPDVAQGPKSFASRD
ncbi:hypothetical protein P154DRAFT_620204 [Amniculicola lignicola CBS 123094]|uniref:Uncharacterized protein n=1 Tax=Amniculicola lignicola CBS 123094 TaxID=1392246 RepID=A0A6A5WS51_9PLEO|nr:hypothetical protein P154DRAFT_620204 [Amniculicola lignicola CBS 123094]